MSFEIVFGVSVCVDRREHILIGGASMPKATRGASNVAAWIKVGRDD